MTLALEQYYAAQADALARKEDRMGQLYGGPDSPQLIKLRCFKYYHPDTGSFLTSPDGVQRWMGPKAARVYAIAHRDAGTHTTMQAIAAEAMCCVSTVSRALTRLQAFGFLAVDVKRGRNGGITVRLRRAGDAMKHYAAAAWKRIRSWIKVASRSPGSGDDLVGSTSRKDATFTEADQHARCREFAEAWRPTIERLGADVLDCSKIDHTPLAPSAASRAADAEQARADRWVRECIAEVRRLQRDEPDWDRYLENVRSSYGIG